jgi:LDH2 family malate/lactate/ureidoglycolate dehydrogenase
LAIIGDPRPTLAGAPAATGGSQIGRMAGVFVRAIDPTAFGGVTHYRSLVEACLRAAKSVHAAPGHEAVLIPGEQSRRTRSQRLRHGVPLGEATCDESACLARRSDVDMPAAWPARAAR